MGLTKKSGSSKETPESARKPSPKHSSIASGDKQSGGLDEIDYLFAEKKKQKQELACQASSRKEKRPNQKKNPGRRAATSSSSSRSQDWVKDGLGGKYNAEGYTGRVEDGMKIYKTHLLQSAKSGTTPDCPFDCDCCYI